MSWASRNPELYDEITRRGIVNHLERIGFDADEDALEDFVDQLQSAPLHSKDHLVYNALLNYADEAISEAGINYFAHKADMARDRMKEI